MMREKIKQEALTWLKTPWHHRAWCKGAGVDCVGLLVGVFNAVGLTQIVEADMPAYPQDIMLHRNEETVLDMTEKYADRVDEPMCGDVILWKFGRIFSHAAIVLDYPQIIHAYRVDGMVTLGDASKGEFDGRECRYYRIKEIE